MNFLVNLAMMLVSYLLQAAMAPKPETPKAGKLDVPTAEEGGVIPVCFGTNLIKSSNVIWYGDAKAVAIRKKGGKK